MAKDDTRPALRRIRRRAKAPADADTDAIVNTETAGSPTGKAQPNVDPARELFTTASHQKATFPRVPDMQRGFETIVTDLFAEGYDVIDEWKAIRRGMVINDALSPDRLKRAANGQEDISIRAHRLYIVAKVEVSTYMRETEAAYGAIRQAAIEFLEAQKANKTRTKQITDADVKAEAARLYPDEWSEVCTRREKSEAMLSQLLRTSEAAKSRCYTVSNMMAPGSRSV